VPCQFAPKASAEANRIFTSSPLPTVDKFTVPDRCAISRLRNGARIAIPVNDIVPCGWRNADEGDDATASDPRGEAESCHCKSNFAGPSISHPGGKLNPSALAAAKKLPTSVV